MEFKHFSHNHCLTFHQVPQGSEIQCSGCKCPATGNAYVCWQCSYFLHEQCFRAARSVKHPSHPLHPLTLVPFPTYPSGSFFCNSCKLGGDGFSYACSECEFDIHVHCALTPDPNPHVSPSPVPAPNYNSQPQNPIYPPHGTTIPNDQQNYRPQPQSTSYPPIPNNPLPNVNPAYPSNQHNPPHGYPQPNATPPANSPTTGPPQPSASQTNNPQTEPATIIKHFSHPHVLKSMEIEQKTGKVCSACEWELSGSVYCCTEPYCSFILDKACFDSPREVRHKSHPLHSLTLVSAPPKGDAFDCYACWRSGKAFAYTCFACSITLHIDCTDWPETIPPGPAHKHALTLHYSAAEASLTCFECKEPVNPKAWRYCCRECGVTVHTGCQMKLQNESGEETEDIGKQLFKLQQQQMLNNFRIQMAHQNAQFMTSLANSWKNF